MHVSSDKKKIVVHWHNIHVRRAYIYMELNGASLQRPAALINVVGRFSVLFGFPPISRRYERGTKARLSFSGGPHAPVNMAVVWKKWMSVEKNPAANCTFAALHCTALYFVRQLFANPWISSGLPASCSFCLFLNVCFCVSLCRKRNTGCWNHSWCKSNTKKNARLVHVSSSSVALLSS